MRAVAIKSASVGERDTAPTQPRSGGDSFNAVTAPEKAPLRNGTNHFCLFSRLIERKRLPRGCCAKKELSKEAQKDGASGIRQRRVRPAPDTVGARELGDPLVERKGLPSWLLCDLRAPKEA